jgi:erythronate-4-phosphate dehydrogenase
MPHAYAAAYCRQHGIAWSNAPGCNAGAVLQYVAAAILEVAQRKNIVLRGKTIGIVGVGHVGRLVAQFSRQVGMTALLCDPPRAQQESMAGFCSLHQIAASADIITFHTPLTHEGRHATFHLADSAFFSKLSRNPVFINTSRGEVVDEPALRHAIANKKVSAAILDVWEGEPLISQATLALTAIGTPHIAGYSIQGKRMAAQMAVRALAYFFHLPLLEWTPEPLPPLPIPMVKPKNQHELHAFCHSFYDIAADDACLRAAPHTAERLRSMYALRQELPLDSMTIF